MDNKKVFKRLMNSLILFGVFLIVGPSKAQNPVEYHQLSRTQYLDKILAVWYAQLIGVNMGWQFEHRQASVKWMGNYPEKITKSLQKNGGAPLDDDWYYEMAALRAFESYGPNLTVQQLGRQWVENRVGTWGSSEMARLNLEAGIPAPASGHPRHNRLWFTMGHQCRGDLPGLLAPCMPNVAAEISDKLGHINSYAEGTDGGILVSTLISMAFFEPDVQQLVRQARMVLHPETPHRQCVDMVVKLAEQGKTARQVFDAVEEKWHAVYPATNNSVSNMGLAVTAIWFGKGDFLTSLNLAFSGGDFTDADCNAAVAGAVVAAIHGMKGIPKHLITPFQNRIKGDYVGPLRISPTVDITISELAEKTAIVGEKILLQHGARIEDSLLILPKEKVKTRAAELFSPNDFTKFWNPDWTLERAGLGAPGGGHRGIRGGTFVDGHILSTFPSNEVLGVVLKRKVRLGNNSSLEVEVAADPGRAWRLDIFVEDEQIHTQLVDGGDPLVWKGVSETGFPPPTEEYHASSKARGWSLVRLDLSPYSKQEVTLRLYTILWFVIAIPVMPIGVI